MNKRTRVGKQSTKSRQSRVEDILAGSPPDAERLRDFSTIRSLDQQWIDHCASRTSSHGISNSLDQQNRSKLETYASLAEKGGSI